MKKIYTSDLSDADWQVIKSNFPAKIIRYKRTYDLRIIINAILYLLKNGCLWRDLPKDFPSYQIVYYYFTIWKKNGVWEKIHEQMYVACREQSGKQRSPSMGLIDSQSVRTDSISSQQDCGIDAGKKTKGRKRHIVVDTMGLIIAVVVHAGNIQDRDGARLVLQKMFDNRSIIARMKVILADGGYRGPKLSTWFSETFKSVKWILKIVLRPEEVSGFQVIPKRWIVERTFAWLNNFRRLSKDYERQITTSQTFIQIAMIKIMAHRLAVK